MATRDECLDAAAEAFLAVLDEQDLTLSQDAA